MAGMAVQKVTDFAKEDLLDADGKQIPKENFFFLELEGGTRMAVRGSGTEPKIKFYCFAQEPVSDEGDLAAAKQRAGERIKELATAVEADARERATQAPPPPA